MVAENIANLRWAFQSAKGSAESASSYGAFLSGGTLPGPMPDHQDFEETTALQMRSARYVAETHVGGAPEMYMGAEAAIAMLYAVLGTVNTTGAADPYTHTVTPATSRPWLTMWRALGNVIFGKEIDCKIDQLVVAGESHRPLKMTATVGGLDPRYDDAAETTAAIEITDRFLFYDGKGALQLEGSAVANIRAFTITINRNGEMIPGDDVIPVDNTEGQFTIDVALTKLFESAALYNRVHWGSASPNDLDPATKDILELGGGGIDLKFTRVAASPGPERSLQLQLPRLALAPFDPQPGTGNTALTEALNLSALQPSGSDAMTAIGLNSRADLTA